jgi:hypothetical protein
MPKKQPIEERFWTKVNKLELGCWIWTGTKNEKGYGTLAVYDGRNKSVRAHRISYELFHGRIPNGMVIDHICRNRLCVNPHHLRAVDHRTNSIENSSSVTAINFAKTHCNRGHELSGYNLIEEPGRRRCRECKNITSRIRRAKRPPGLPKANSAPSEAVTAPASAGGLTDEAGAV